jgi:tetratricopeptide (TPR) repeat protein
VNLDAPSVPSPQEIPLANKIAPPLLLLLALVAYAPALRAGFVWDDHALVLRDPLIRSWRLIWEGFQHFLFTDAGASDFYRPLQRLTYLIDYAAFVFAPAGYHLVSVLWHAAAGVALFFFAAEFLRFCKIGDGRCGWLALLAALIWLVHPVQNAAVAYISGRADPLAAAFGFLALFLGLRMLHAPRGRRLLFGGATSLCLLASALSKEMGLLFLLLWFIIVLAHRPRPDLWRAAGMIAAVLVIYLSLRLPAERIAPPIDKHPPPLLVRPIVVARAVAEYAGLLVLPVRLHMDRDVETHPFGFVRASLEQAAWRELQTLLGLILIAAAFYALWRVRRRPAIVLPFLLALVSYLPVSGFFRLNATVAEHWLYLPSAFLFLGVVVALDSLGALRVGLLRVCLTIWILFLAGRTFARTFDWKDQRTFLTRTIAAGGDSTRMWINLGGLELSDGRPAAARQALQKALAKEPASPRALLTLAAVAIKQREFAKARGILQKVTDPPEMEARAQESLAVIENRESGRVNLMRLRLAARLGAADWEIEKRYIQALADGGVTDRAITELKTCIVTAPYRAESWLMMSELLQAIGHPIESASALSQAEAYDIHLHEHAEPVSRAR